MTIAVVACLACLGAPVWVMSPPPRKTVTFPHGKKFAFTIVDDTDHATFERVRPIYETLEKYGLRTTKTVWVYDSNDATNGANMGDSLQNPRYREFIVGLQRKGFEIALHGVRGGSSPRADVLAGLEDYKRILGAYPRMLVNHSLNEDNLYWGGHLFGFAPYRWVGRLGIRHKFSGHEPSSPYFWGDVAKQRIDFVRRFTFPDINLLAANPSMPYKLADKPYVNHWFPTSNGNRMNEFEELLKPEQLDRLEREGGVCIVYAHLGMGSFSTNGVNPRFEARIKDIASRNGWFASASEILDFLKAQPGWTGELSLRERLRIETKFLGFRAALTLN